MLAASLELCALLAHHAAALESALYLSERLLPPLQRPTQSPCILKTHAAVWSCRSAPAAPPSTTNLKSSTLALALVPRPARAQWLHPRMSTPWTLAAACTRPSALAELQFLKFKSSLAAVFPLAMALRNARANRQSSLPRRRLSWRRLPVSSTKPRPSCARPR